MNYLAHLFLSCPEDKIIIGNFIGDDIRNDVLDELPATVQRGVMLHRTIDVYTDQHEEVKKATKLIRDTQRKYAPVVVDVMFDYFLCKNWELYSGDESIDAFSDRVYGVLSHNMELIPTEKLKARTQRMIDARFLDAYRTVEGIDQTMYRIAKRARFKNKLDVAAKEMVDHEVQLNDIFNSFFPELREVVASFCDGASLDKSE